MLCCVLSSDRINGLRAKTSRKTMRERAQHPKGAAKPPTFGALFPSFGGVERARARFSHAGHRWALILSDDDTLVS